MFGEVPTAPSPIKKSFQLIAEDQTIFDGLCTRKEVLITFENEKGAVSMPLVLFVPTHAADNVPVILLPYTQTVKQLALLGWQHNNWFPFESVLTQH